MQLKSNPIKSLRRYEWGNREMKSAIKFSVLIPTRNRLDLLKEAIASVRNQSYDNWELIVSDNCSDDDVEGYVYLLGDDRIVYYRQPAPVSVTDNWNTANDMATGDYMIMLGDDDALVPDALEILEKRIADGHPQVISFMAYLYLQPNVDPHEKTGDVNLINPFSMVNLMEGQILSLDWRRRTIKKCFSFERVIGYNMQFYCYSKEMVKILQEYGKFYEPPYPDYYTTSMCMLLAESFVYIPKALAVIGITPKSYGYYYRNNIEKEGMTFHKEEDYRLYAPLSVCEKLCSVDELDTAAFATFALVSERTGIVPVSLEGYYGAVIKRELQCNGNLDETMQLIGSEMSFHVSEESRKKLEMYAQRLWKGMNKGDDGVELKGHFCFTNIAQVLLHIGEIEEAVQEQLKEMEEAQRQLEELFPDIKDWMKESVIKNLHKYSRGREVLIWGAYPRGDYLRQELERAGFEVKGFIDKTFEEVVYGCKRVFRPEDVINTQKQEYLLIPLLHEYPEIIMYLNSHGYQQEQDYLYIGFKCCAG